MSFADFLKESQDRAASEAVAKTNAEIARIAEIHEQIERMFARVGGNPLVQSQSERLLRRIEKLGAAATSEDIVGLVERLNVIIAESKAAPQPEMKNSTCGVIALCFLFFVFVLVVWLPSRLREPDPGPRGAMLKSSDEIIDERGSPDEVHIDGKTTTYRYGNETLILQEQEEDGSLRVTGRRWK